jgi:hypothetical protein
LPALLAIPALLGPVRAEDEVGSKEDSAARLAMMRKIAGSIAITQQIEGKPGSMTALRPAPILRYNDPPRHMLDATLWAWGGRGRPVAVLKVEFQPTHPPPRRWVLSLVALGPNRISVEFHDGQHWASTRPGLELRAIPGASPPAATETLRLVQMRTLARRFAATEGTGVARGQLQLRLMPTPLDRYPDPASGLRDGVIFGLATGTNPDLFLVIEAVTNQGASPTWHYGFARNGGGEFTASLDGQAVWTAGMANPPAQLETYMNRRMAEGTEPR